VYFDMKVTAAPPSAAISFAPCLKIAWLSAVWSASRYVKLISCGAGELVAHLADQPLVLGGLEHVVVHDVVGRRLQPLVSLLRGLVERVLEHVELELRAGLDLVALGGRSLDLTLEDLARCDLDRLVRLLVVDVADHERRLVDPRDEAERRQVRHHLEVAVARLPAGVLVPGERLHLHVDREEVQARVQALFAEDLLEEEVGEDPLAHEAALQVREHAEHSVDLTRIGELFERLDVDLPPLHQALLLDADAGGRGGLRPPRPRSTVRSVRRYRASGGGLGGPLRRIASCSCSLATNPACSGIPCSPLVSANSSSGDSTSRFRPAIAK
jgi:hypothetical protein